jgi:hypothetical protein
MAILRRPAEPKKLWGFAAPEASTSGLRFAEHGTDRRPILGEQTNGIFRVGLRCAEHGTDRRPIACGDLKILGGKPRPVSHYFPPSATHSSPKVTTLGVSAKTNLGCWMRSLEILGEMGLRVHCFRILAFSISEELNSPSAVTGSKSMKTQQENAQFVFDITGDRWQDMELICCDENDPENPFAYAVCFRNNTAGVILEDPAQIRALYIALWELGVPRKMLPKKVHWSDRFMRLFQPLK